MANALTGRILVTGATGFVGRHTIDAFEGHDVIGVSLKGNSCLKAKVVPCNLLDHKSIRNLIREFRPSYLLHLAWEAKPGTYWTDPINREWAVAGELLYREFLEQGGTKAVFAGSVAEYEWKSRIYSEANTPIAPATLYGECKANLFGRMTAINKSSFTWARLFYLYGPHEAPGRLVSSAFNSLMAGRPFPTTDGSQIRDFLHVKDLASALKSVLHSNLDGAVNIGSGEFTPVRKVIETVGQIVNKSDLIEFGKIPQRPNDPPEIVANIERLITTGWRPQFNLREGLEDTHRWWKAQ